MREQEKYDSDTILYLLSMNPQDHLLRLSLIKHYLAHDQSELALLNISQGLNYASDKQIRLKLLKLKLKLEYND